MAWPLISYMISSTHMRKKKRPIYTFEDDLKERLKNPGFRKAWEEVVKENSASDPLFKEITASYNAFREDYSIWSSKAYLKR